MESREETIRKRYADFVRGRIDVQGLLGVGLVAAILAALMGIDIFVNRHPPVSAAMRIPPLVFALFIIAWRFLPFRRALPVISAAYYLLLMGIVAMAGMRVTLFSGTEWFPTSVTGLILAILVVFLMAHGGALYLAPVYGLPLIAAFAFMAAAGGMDHLFSAAMANPVIAAVICLARAETRERLRYREFRANAMLELHKTKLEERNRTLEEEMDLAGRIQQACIPRSVPRIRGARFSMIYRPMDRLGGDFLDFITFKESHQIGILLCDVSGHGIPAALLTGMVKILTSADRDRLRPPAAFLNYVNETMHGKTSGHFVTALYGIYDARKRSITIARAGHPHPLLIRGGEMRELEVKGNFIGLTRDIAAVENTFPLERGDRLLFFTDGLTEATDSRGISFESGEMRRLLMEHHAGDIEDLLKKLYRGLVDFTGGERFDDDVCIVGMEIA